MLTSERAALAIRTRLTNFVLTNTDQRQKNVLASAERPFSVGALSTLDTSQRVQLRNQKKT
jgi:hypothetical protein